MSGLISYQTRFYKTKTLDKAPDSMDYVKGYVAAKYFGIILYEWALNAVHRRLDKMIQAVKGAYGSFSGSCIPVSVPSRLLMRV
jgi:hypothetical protein